MPKKVFFVFSLFCLFAPLASFSQETIDIITTYTSPAGVYDQLLATSFATRTLGVGDTNGDLAYNINDAPDPATQSGWAWIAGRVGVSTNSPGALFHASWDSTGSDRVIAIIGSGPTTDDVQLHIKQDSGRNRIELQAQNGGTGAVVRRNLILNPDGGNVGFGTLSGSAKLKVDKDVEVSGVAQVKGTGGSCDSANRGTIEFNGANFRGCTSSGWIVF